MSNKHNLAGKFRELLVSLKYLNLKTLISKLMFYFYTPEFDLIACHWSVFDCLYIVINQ
jgi:hypothetical protein